LAALLLIVGAAPAAAQPTDATAAAPEPTPGEPAPEPAPISPDAEPEPAPATADDEGRVEPKAAARRRSVAAGRARRERTRPRPSLPPPAEVPEEPAWERHLEIGADFAFALRPFADAKVESDIEYQPAPGWGVHLRWQVIPWLRIHAYFVNAYHGLDIPPDTLMAATENSIAAGSTVSDASVQTFSFGIKGAPTWNFTPRVRAWVSVGVGWGKFNFSEMTITEPSGNAFLVRDRSSVFVEFPLGLGVGVDVIERWLAITYEASACPATGQSGDAHEVFQAVDAAGSIRDVGPFGGAEVSFVQTLGVSLIL
jgi:hypothetical protein